MRYGSPCGVRAVQIPKVTPLHLLPHRSEQLLSSCWRPSGHTAGQRCGRDAFLCDALLEGLREEAGRFVSRCPLFIARRSLWHRLWVCSLGLLLDAVGMGR